ncbi:MAG: HEAT repeat domain-containing protein [Gemmataceae bacterium]
MTSLNPRLLCLFLPLLLPIPARAEDNPSPFSKEAEMVLAGGAMQHAQLGIVPGLSAWSSLNDPKVPLRFESFPAKLLKALDAPDSNDHQPAVSLVLSYAAVARTSAAEREVRDLEAVVDRVFAPHAKAIRTSLEKGLKAPDHAQRLEASLALLAFNPEHPKANGVLSTAMRSEDAALRKKAVARIGDLRLSTPKALSLLVQALEQKDPEVRRAAAVAASRLGPKAKVAVTALTHFLRSGQARGETHSLAIDLPQEKNLAVSALAQIGPDAASAVPALIDELKRADESGQCEVLACLAAIGSAAKESLPALRVVMASKKPRLRLTAACALLGVSPHDNQAAEILAEALRDKDKKNLDRALECCLEVRPKATALTRRLVALLDDESERVRIQASRALGHIGPDAAEAIPTLEKLLNRNGSGLDHTFQSHAAAADTLCRLGPKARPALLAALKEDREGRMFAILALAHLGAQSKPAVAALARIAKEEKDTFGFIAAIALGQLGDQARAARPVLEAVRVTEFQAHLAYQWALMEIPK